MPPWTEAAAADYAQLTKGMTNGYVAAMERLAFDEALDAMWLAIQAANRYVEERKPWAQAKADDLAPLKDTLRTLLEVLRAASILCVPVMPVKAAQMRQQLGLPDEITGLSIDEANRPGEADWRTVGKPSSLFPKIEPPAVGEH